ncbi:hypothetical protein FisN_14Lu341 [Fistulifera solaris]|uniref:Uncharacterized protein n=1 Tax=Fistulifera solaris TaxID=1519565 RepID=A0A1Z5JI16_FISSO|nr:hypothetical protein FisN_14Lu341 [Fistulifera solaris]|eukprot:GAX13647.1 hypothetical protein FisN_14Lu341 [Fistulifera solaris]
MKDDPVLLFDSVSHYFERLDVNGRDALLRNGTAEAFARSLCDQCRLHQQSLEACVSDVAESKTVQNARILHISVLCKALAVILRCSDSELKSSCHATMKQHLIEPVPYVAHMMLTLEGYDSLQPTTVINAVRIMHRLAPLLEQLPPDFLNSTTSLLNENMPADVRTEAALCVANFLTHERNTMFKFDAEICERLVSILSVSAVTCTETNAEQAMKALATLMISSTHFAKMARRKCCILVAKENLHHDGKAIRRSVFEILDAVVKNHELENGPAGIFESNMEYVVQALMEGASIESDASLLKNILDLLVRIMTSENLPLVARLKADILEALARIATDGNRLHGTEHAAACYLKIASKCIQEANVLSRVVDLMASSHAPVRSQALVMMQDQIFWKPSIAEVLFCQTSFVEKISVILHNGSQQERVAVIQICTTLVSDSQNHRYFLQCEECVNALADFVTSNETKDRSSLVAALNILLDLMLTTEHGINSFVRKLNLLPWMVSLANRTSCGKLKARLVAAIQRMTSRLLNQSD